MTNKIEPRRIAVVGVGPRGLSAIESLVARASGNGIHLSIDLLDPIACPGAGPNFGIDENPLCLLNTPMRAIAIAPPNYPGVQCGAFSDSLSGPFDPDDFPTRPELGRCLVARLENVLSSHLDGLSLSLQRAKVTNIARRDDGWTLSTDTRCFGPYDEVLLTQGQPESKPDEQLARWQKHAGRFDLDLLPAYPSSKLLSAATGWVNRNVAIRGLGLSTIDVIRLLTVGMGGHFKDDTYVHSGREPSRLLPFSLDGLAPYPKPATTALYSRFDPLDDETRQFQEAVSRATTGSPEDALHAICQALVSPIFRIMDDCGTDGDEISVRHWLDVERVKPGSQENRSTADALRFGIAMAEGSVPPSVGYVAGQIWRKWQNALRQEFNFNVNSPDVAKAIIDFDEGFKRHSYGPPASSAKELLILVEAGLVSPRVADDPDIHLVEDGWELVTGDTSSRASALVDAVLPSPALEQTADPLISQLRAEGMICPVHDGLGARINFDGQLIDCKANIQTGLSTLGRVALGTVIAVDSIHDCFGACRENWVGGVISRAR